MMIIISHPTEDSDHDSRGARTGTFTITALLLLQSDFLEQYCQVVQREGVVWICLQRAAIKAFCLWFAAAVRVQHHGVVVQRVGVCRSDVQHSPVQHLCLSIGMLLLTKEQSVIALVVHVKRVALHSTII